MYDKILVPMALDHGVSHLTLEVARRLRNPGGEIIALHVYDIPESAMRAMLNEDLVEEGFSRASKELKSKTEGQSDLRVHIVRGQTYRSIISEAEKEGVSCIVMGSHKPGGLADYLIGSTAARVVRHATCAVHVCR